MDSNGVEMMFADLACCERRICQWQHSCECGYFWTSQVYDEDCPLCNAECIALPAG